MPRLLSPSRFRPSRPRRRPGRAAAARGFTLIEAALTGVIVGTGVLAMVSAQQAYHIKNNWALRTGTGQLLANEVRELMLSLQPFDPADPFGVGAEDNEAVGAASPADPASVANWDDVDDFAGVETSPGQYGGVSFNPPINGLAERIDELSQWTQEVRLQSVLPDALNTDGRGLEREQVLNRDASEALPLGVTDMLRVTCTVTYRQTPEAPPETITSLTWIIPR